MMNEIIYYIGLCLILPILLLSFYLEKRARRIIISMICGVLAGSLAFNINYLCVKLLDFSTDNVDIALAPYVEEICKFIPIILISLIVKKGKRGSAANAFAVGVGFCVIENLLYLFSAFESGNVNVFWVILRCVGTGLMHSMSSTLIGIGVYKARINKKYSIFYIIGSLLCAMAMHLIFNLLVRYDILNIIGVLMPIIIFILLFFILRKKEIHDYLWDKNNKEETN